MIVGCRAERTANPASCKWTTPPLHGNALYRAYNTWFDCVRTYNMQALGAWYGRTYVRTYVSIELYILLDIVYNIIVLALSRDTALPFTVRPRWTETVIKLIMVSQLSVSYWDESTLELKPATSACLAMMSFYLGACADQDCEEGVQSDHREILHSSYYGFPHEQAGLRGHCHYSEQKTSQQDCRVRF